MNLYAKTEPTVKTWDAVWKQNDSDQPKLIGKRIFEEISREIDIKGQEILELGCGRCELLRLAAEQGARRVIGVDMSGEAIKLAARMLNGFEHELIQSDFFKLAPEPRADIVWSSGVVEHYRGDRLLEIIKLHRQISRKYVVIVVPASPHWNNIRMRQKKMIAQFGWQQPLSKRRLKNLGFQAGLKMLGIRRFMTEYWIPSKFIRSYIYSFQNRFAWFDQLLGGLVVAWYKRDDV
jgi:cyclopropane fatty-acyl-phospholipid synthase-like methyltransferase